MADIDGNHERTQNPSLVALWSLWGEGNGPLLALYIMMFLEVAGWAMCFPVLSFFAIKELGLTPRQLGIIVSASASTQLVGSWVCGRVSDAVGRRWLILGCFAWSTLGIGLTAFVRSFEELLILRLLQGLSGGTTPLCQAYILDWIGEERRPGFLGLFGFTIGIAFLVGNLLGMGLLALGLARRTIFLVAATSDVVATLYGLCCIRESLDVSRRRPISNCCAQIGHSDEHDEITENKISSDWEVLGPGMGCVWLARFFAALAGAVLFSSYAFLIDDFFGWSDMHLGAIMAAFGLSYAVLQALVYPLFGQRGKFGSALAVLVAGTFGIAGASAMPIRLVFTHVLALLCVTMASALVAPAIPVLVGYFAGRRFIGFGNGVATSFEKAAGILGPLLGTHMYEYDVVIMCVSAGVCYAFCVFSSAGIFLSDPIVENVDEREQEPLASKTA